MHAYHACSASCIHRYHALFMYSLCYLLSILKISNKEEALVNLAEIGEIGTEETPSRKRKQSKGNKLNYGRPKKWIFLSTYCNKMRAGSSSISILRKSLSHSHHFVITWSIFDQQFLYNIIVVSLSSPWSSLVYFLFSYSPLIGQEGL